MKTYALKPKLEPEQRALVARYVVARRRSAEAAAEADRLKGDVLAIVQRIGPMTLNDALVEVKETVRYRYPVAIQELENQLKSEKKVAQLKGTAEKQIEPALQFRDLRRPSEQKEAA